MIIVAVDLPCNGFNDLEEILPSWLILINCHGTEIYLRLIVGKYM